MGGLPFQLLEASPCFLKGNPPSFPDSFDLMLRLFETSQMLLHLLNDSIDLEISEIHLPETFQDLLLFLSDLSLNLAL